MIWNRRAREDVREVPPPTPAPGRGPAAPAGNVLGDDADSPAALRRAVDQLDRFVNRNAGRLPSAAVVNARAVTDTLRQVIDTSATRPLDVYAVIAIRGIVDDYLPTTLSGYLAVAPDLRDVARSSGFSPTRSLIMQLDALQSSASATLVAAREQDADALMSQGTFLRVKFSGSDLDL